MAMKWIRNNVDGMTVYKCEVGGTRYLIWNLGRNGARLVVQKCVAVQNPQTREWVDAWCSLKSMERLLDNVRMAKERAEFYFNQMG